MSPRAERAMLWAIVAVALAVRLFFLFGAPNVFSAEHEGYSKINLMFQWDQSPLPYPDTNFGPLHTLFLWIPWKLTGHAVWPARLLTLAMGMLLLWPLVRLVRRHAGPEAAGASLFAGAFLYPLSVASVVTLSEVPFVCCTLWAIDLLDDVVAHQRTAWAKLVGAALAAAAAAAFRFEGWPLLVVYVGWLAAHRRFRETLVFGAMVAVFPLMHMAECVRVTGNPFSFLGVSAEVSAIHASEVPLVDRIGLLPHALAATIGWPGLLLGLIGLVAAFTRRKLLLPAVSLVVLLILLEKKAIDATLDPRLLRYMSLSATLLVLFIALPLTTWARTWRRSTWLVALALVAAVVAGFSHANTVAAQRMLGPDRAAFRFVEKLRPELREDDRVLLGNEYHPIIVVESGLPWDRFRRPIYDAHGGIDREQLRRLFEEWKPTLFFYDRSESAFGEALGLPPGVSSTDIFGVAYARLWSHDRWSVFRRKDETP
ncbi:MAG: glycosyltransferase family 39 protein [Candidatus Lernaella stagnicola]|nr:glycosyltransferase family 39 protein [Candidatus Lernaella stagnicola]